MFRSVEAHWKVEAAAAFVLLMLAPASVWSAPGPSGGTSVRVVPGATAVPVTYRVDLSNRARKRVGVTMTVPNPPRRLVAVMPAWTPGAYRLEFWAKNVFPISARCGTTKLRWRRLDRSRWELRSPPTAGATPACTVELKYEVYAPNLTDNGSHVDLSHAYLNGASVFMYLEGARKRGCRMEVALPSGWKAFAALRRVSGGQDTAVFTAKSYDALIDAPLEAGDPIVRKVRVKGAQVTVLLCRAGRETLPRRLGRDIKKIFEWQSRLMGGLPFKKYVILVHLWKKNRYAGLEHAASTSILVPPSVLNARGPGYHHLLYIIGHELFHAWNTRRFVPREIGTARLDAEVYSPLLWWVEGTADYYAYRSLLGSRIWSRRRYLREISRLITRMHASRSHRKYSLKDMGVAIWNPSDDSDLALNLYPKSHAAALGLDLAIRTASAGRASLDRVMRRMEMRARRLGKVYLYGRTHLAALIRQTATKDLRPVVRRLVRSKGVMLTAGLLKPAGFKMKVLTGYLPTGLGLSAVFESGGWRIRNVQTRSPASAAGLKAGDLVLTLNGGPPSPDWTSRRVSVAGTRYRVKLKRQGRVLQTVIKAGPRRIRQYWLKRSSRASSSARRVRRKWLRARIR